VNAALSHDGRGRSIGLVVAAAAGLSALTAGVVVERPELFNLSGVVTPGGAALLLAGLTLGAFCLRLPDVALCCLVAFVALNLSDVLVRTHGLPSLLQVSFVPLALAGWWHNAPGSPPLPRTITLLLAGYLVVVLGSTTFAADRAAADARLLELLRGFAIFVVFVLLARSTIALRRGVWTFVLCAAALSLMAIAQVATGDFTLDFAGLARIKYAQVYGSTFEPRIAGPLGDPNFFAQILVLAVPIALYLAWTETDVRRRALAFGAAGLSSVAAVFTYSRGGALALAVVLAAAVLVRGLNLRKAALAGVPAVLLLWMALPDDFAMRLTTLGELLPGSEDVLRPDSSFGERRLFTATAWRMFADAPLMGVGAGNYGHHFVDYSQQVGMETRLYVTPAEGYFPHNLYLEVAAETGLAGLAPFVLALAVCFEYLWRARRSWLAEGDESSAGLATGCAIGLGGYLLAGLFLHGDFIRYWWLAVGFAAASYRLSPAGRSVGIDVGEATAEPAAKLPPTESGPGAEDLDDAAATPGALRPAIAVIISRFPLVTETFILREIVEMERQGQPVVLVPLLRERPAVVHREAAPWIRRAVYTPFLSLPIVAANVRMLYRRPWLYVSTLWQVAAGSVGSPNFFVRSLTLFPKAVYLAGRFEREGIQHVHAHYATHPTTVALVASALTGVTFSFTVHAHDIFVRRALLRRKLEAAAFVRSISRFNRAFLARHYPDALVRKVQVVHVGIDPEQYERAVDEPAAPPHLLCVASLQPYKGIPVLLEAAALVRTRGVDFTCTIVGEGTMRPALEAQLRRLGLERVVTLAGARPQHEVALLMRTASVLVMPSIVAPDGQMEGIPVAVMEAMASRLPVVASSLSGIPEAVENGVTGVLAEPGDSADLARGIEAVLAAGHAATVEMGDRARAAIEHGFRLDTCVSTLLGHIDRFNPPPDDAALIMLPVVHAGVAHGPVGLRRRLEGRDSRVAQLLVANGRMPHEIVLKSHKCRPGQSRPAAERASREFQFLRDLEQMPADGVGVPRPLHLDAERACLLMEPCRGEPLDALIRAGRFTRDETRTLNLASAVQRTGRWLRHFQWSTPRDGNPAMATDRLIDSATAHLEQCRGHLLTTSAANAVRAQLEALKPRLAPASQRLVNVHRDFWPGNVFVAPDVVEVIDFEGADAGLPYEDVAYFLVQLEQFFPGPYPRRGFGRLGTVFLGGYLAEDEGFDWAAYELCRVASALQILSGTASQRATPRMRWRRRLLRGIIVGGAA